MRRPRARDSLQGAQFGVGSLQFGAVAFEVFGEGANDLSRDFVVLGGFVVRKKRRKEKSEFAASLPKLRLGLGPIFVGEAGKWEASKLLLLLASLPIYFSLSFLLWQSKKAGRSEGRHEQQ